MKKEESAIAYIRKTKNFDFVECDCQTDVTFHIRKSLYHKSFIHF